MKKIFIASIIFLLTFFVSPKMVSADCEIASWNEDTRDLQVCVGGFDTVEELRSTTAEFKCLSNSNVVNPESGRSFCRDVTNPTYSLASTTDNNIAQDASGQYYTCLTAQGINRAIGYLEVRFTGGTTCTTDPIVTRPDDWGLFEEGMPWDEGTNDPIRPGTFRDLTCADGTSIDTAIGCIPISDTNALIAFILRWAIGIGGGIAFLLILFAGFQIITSSGNPEKLKAGQELMTSAVAGLIMLIFSVFILRIIGVDILKLPGF